MMYIVLTVIGLALGSFTNALAWRVYQQTKTKSPAKQRKLSITKGRSLCPHCEHQLSSKDLIPLVSWLLLRGRCRYCKKPISVQYPIVELVVAAALVTSYAAWPYDFSHLSHSLLFLAWAAILVLLAALCICDLRWMTLPTRLIYALTVPVGIVVVSTAFYEANLTVLTDAVLGMAALGGLFWVLYQVSNGRWIGGGDVRYGFVAGALLGWQKALFCLALASYLGTVLVIVLLLLGKYKKGLRVPFGPFLIAATYISFLWGQHVIDWYLRLAGLTG